MLTEAFRVGQDGKVIEGWTVLRDPQTGQWYDVLDVASGKMPGPLWPRRFGGSAAESCALIGGPAKWRED